MPVLELLTRLDLLACSSRVEQGCSLSLIVVDWEGLVDAQDSVHTSRGYVLAVLTELDNPGRLLADLNLMQVLQIIQLHILLLDYCRLDPTNLLVSKRLSHTYSVAARRRILALLAREVYLRINLLLLIAKMTHLLVLVDDLALRIQGHILLLF